MQQDSRGSVYKGAMDDQIEYCKKDFERFFRLNGFNGMFISTKAVFMQYLYTYYTDGVIKITNTIVRDAWGKDLIHGR